MTIISRRREDNDWEDISDGETSTHTTRSPPGSPRPKVSRRVKGSKTVKSRAQTKPSSLQHQGKQKHSEPSIASEDFFKAATTFLMLSLRYFAEVSASAISLLRKPLSIMLFLYLLGLVFSRVLSTLQSTLKPFCILPVISSLSVCQFGIPDHTRSPKWANYPKLVDMQSQAFENLLENTVGGSALALNIKKVEMATSDLVTLTRISDLKSRDLLAESLSAFVFDARKTGRGLTKLSAKVGGTVDHILALNDYALHSIEASQNQSPSGFAAVVRAVVPGASHRANDVVLRTFTDSMNVLSSSIQRLILEAEAELANLDKLEQDLFVIHEIISREDASLNAAKFELLSLLWTKLGGNRRALQGYNENLSLLKDLGVFRKKALAQVMMALQALRILSDDMEDLRERVANPELVESKIPVEVHLKSIRGGIERLKESRVRSKEQDDAALSKILSLEE